MKILTIKQFVEFRDDLLSKRETWQRDFTNSRGSVVEIPSFVISDDVSADDIRFPMDAVELQTAKLWGERQSHVGDIEDAYYEHCENLKKADSQMGLSELSNTRRFSRNAIRANLASTMTLWQLHGGVLDVYCRSMDVEHFGIVNLKSIWNVAKRLGCERFNVFVACPHVYIDDSAKVGGTV